MIRIATSRARVDSRTITIDEYIKKKRFSFHASAIAGIWIVIGLFMIFKGWDIVYFWLGLLLTVLFPLFGEFMLYRIRKKYMNKK